MEILGPGDLTYGGGAYPRRSRGGRAPSETRERRVNRTNVLSTFDLLLAGVGLCVHPLRGSRVNGTEVDSTFEGSTEPE